ncbi:hypothetical protein AGMMS50276_32390 [Synergistales bacterium]|nr:hypothetical protein AGMMS50276_32390 [Synergistales bacterium]
MLLIILICVTLFWFGLYSWAQSGATLWELHSVKKKQASRMTPAARSAQVFLELAEMDDVVETKAKKNAKNGVYNRTLEMEEKDPLIVIHELETTFDRIMRSSFRILGTLVVCVWAFAILTFVLDAFNVDWVGRISYTAARFWNPSISAPATVYNAQNRDTQVKQNIFLRGLNLKRRQ